MPKFYFDLRKEGDLVLDEEGADFPEITSAVEDAKAAARELIGEHIKMNDTSILTYSFEIADENGTPVRTVEFNEALQDDTGPSPSKVSSIH